jgi:hypothetical protein
MGVLMLSVTCRRTAMVRTMLQAGHPFLRVPKSDLWATQTSLSPGHAPVVAPAPQAGPPRSAGATTMVLVMVAFAAMARITLRVTAAGLPAHSQALGCTQHLEVLAKVVLHTFWAMRLTAVAAVAVAVAEVAVVLVWELEEMEVHMVLSHPRRLQGAARRPRFPPRTPWVAGGSGCVLPMSCNGPQQKSPLSLQGTTFQMTL